MSKYPKPTDAPHDEWIPTRVEHPTGRPNFCVVYTPHAWLAYSYETLIGVRPIVNGMIGDWVLRKNEWGPTTGKHLNWIKNNSGGRWDTRQLDAKGFKLVAESVLHNDRAYLHSLAKEAFRALEGAE